MDTAKIFEILDAFVKFLIGLLRSVGVINEKNEDIVNQYIDDGKDIGGAIIG